MPEKKCSRCKIAFQCGCDKEGCWCEGLLLEKSTLEQLKEEFDNCLCNNCLTQYSVKAQKNNYGS